MTPPPPWFAKAMVLCEAFSLDDADDRQMLWERLSEAWPLDAIEAAISDQQPRDMEGTVEGERMVASIKAAVITALEEA